MQATWFYAMVAQPGYLTKILNEYKKGIWYKVQFWKLQNILYKIVTKLLGITCNGKLEHYVTPFNIKVSHFFGYIRGRNTKVWANFQIEIGVL